MNTEIRDQPPSQAGERMFVEPVVMIEARSDGTRVLRSGIPLPDNYGRCVGEWLEHWAREAPERVFLAERGGDGRWVELRYGEARRRVVAIATWLLDQQLSPERPVVILSDNGIEHALLMLAAMHVGVPSCAISTGNSLMSKDFGKLKANIELLRPGVIYADGIERFRPAIDAVAQLHNGVVIAGGQSADVGSATPFVAIEQHSDEPRVMSAFNRVTLETIGKFLFTSGSVGVPKAVINTQRMMVSNQEAKALMWPFLRSMPPVLVDWLPWSHTFGANHNLNMVLRWGGTLYIDDGKPVPALLPKTVRNLKEISPTVYFNVPRAFDMLVPLLREDADFRERFFRKLKFVFYAGAALPHHLWTALEDLSVQATGEKILMVSAWGATETAPTASDCHFRASRPGVIGLPVPGTALKLVPTADKMEVRVKGPNVFPGYWKQPDVTAKAFDDEGYYLTGDAVEFVDPSHPTLGLVFDGRVGEDFKLLTGTWVHVGSLRVSAIDCMKPVAQDIVVTGHDRDEIGFLIFPNIPECRTLCPGLPPDAPVEDVLSNPAVVNQVRAGLQALKQRGGGSSTYATRALLMAEAPSVEHGEITDKGYINQRLVLSRRTDLLAYLYGDLPDKGVITVHSATDR
ncbi:feruloyl-CoA synthase [Denitromonas iodatirespirans]|uniref:Feruloyl-CoA synthase n=1 Tax=Denitromonas iodatirespirans TaxID=2795389 RepID=A0A944DDI0_DENI1|nr:feruloyl-CoA synthase [Denitromonas iodatirespirans]MBT0963477.1 feruloyl-CoA synthase [Denitromonas iodatirespirans]